MRRHRLLRGLRIPPLQCLQDLVVFRQRKFGPRASQRRLR